MEDGREWEGQHRSAGRNCGCTEQVAVRPSHLHFVRVQRCTLLEDFAEGIPVTGNEIRLTMKPFGILTLRLNTRVEPQR